MCLSIPSVNSSEKASQYNHEISFFVSFFVVVVFLLRMVVTPLKKNYASLMYWTYRSTYFGNKLVRVINLSALNEFCLFLQENGIPVMETSYIICQEL